MTNATSLNYQSRLDTATPITYGQIVSGSITDQQRYQLYAFEGQQGDLVTIGMELTGGTLDTALYLISPEGIQLAYNDDVTAGDNTNSVIEQATLASTGTTTSSPRIRSDVGAAGHLQPGTHPGITPGHLERPLSWKVGLFDSLRRTPQEVDVLERPC